MCVGIQHYTVLRKKNIKKVRPGDMVVVVVARSASLSSAPGLHGRVSESLLFLSFLSSYFSLMVFAIQNFSFFLHILRIIVESR